jgi:ubiquinone/menaquinone biosynthesis C-methylase UbiE
MFDKWFRHSTLDPLGVSMTGAKLGDRLLVVGCRDPKLIALLAKKTGLTGRACAVDDSPGRVKDAERAAAEEGVLIEAFSAPLYALPFDAEAFDVVVVRNVLLDVDPSARVSIVDQALRVLRPGGRVILIEPSGRAAGGGFSALFQSKPPPEPSPDAQALCGALQQIGFVAVRAIAERERLLFVEGVKRAERN